MLSLRKYNKYNNRNSFHIHLLDDPLDLNKKKDHQYMVEQLKVHDEYLNSHGITAYLNFSNIFKKYFISATEEKAIISSFLDQNDSIFLLKSRELKKASAPERNILYNRLFFQYPIAFLNHVEKFIQSNFLKRVGIMDNKNKNALITDIRTKIEQLHNQKKEKIDSMPASHVDESNCASNTNIISNTNKESNVFNNNNDDLKVLNSINFENYFSSDTMSNDIDQSDYDLDYDYQNPYNDFNENF